MLDIDPRRTALVLVDLQKGVLDTPLAPHSAERVVDAGARLGRRLADLGGTVVLVHVAFSETFADKLSQPVDAPTNVSPGDLPPDWTDFAPEIAALRTDVLITKRQWGAFHGTELDLQLRRRGITMIVLGGVTTNFGVESTAREAWQHNYAVIVAEDATSSASADMHEFSIRRVMPRIARVRSTTDVLDALR